MHEQAFKAMMLAWSQGIVLSNRNGKCWLAFSKAYAPDQTLVRELKTYKDTILKALPEEVA